MNNDLLNEMYRKNGGYGQLSEDSLKRLMKKIEEEGDFVIISALIPRHT